MENSLPSYRTTQFLKLPACRFDSKDMATNNELIVVIDSARSSGNSVKCIRKQKYAPSQFYMTLANGKQLGPVSCQGDSDELSRKFDEAQSYLNRLRNPGTRIAA